MSKNVIVAQSGGPLPVINNSLRGVIDDCLAYPADFGRIYGAWHGIEGVLKEELLDISAQDLREIALLATTPAAGAIGTCRYKLKEKQVRDFARFSRGKNVQPIFQRRIVEIRRGAEIRGADIRRKAGIKTT